MARHNGDSPSAGSGNDAPDITVVVRVVIFATPSLPETTKVLRERLSASFVWKHDARVDDVLEASAPGVVGGGRDAPGIRFARKNNTEDNFCRVVPLERVPEGCWIIGPHSING